MAATKIPEEISKYRPGPCTEIKFIKIDFLVFSSQKFRTVIAILCMCDYKKNGIACADRDC